MPTPPTRQIEPQSVLGGVVAGGLSRRMGGVEKSFIELANTPLIAHVIGRLKPQVSSVAINANGDVQRFADYGHPVVSDIVEGFAGPLAGIHALMTFALKQKPHMSHIASVAADTPFFPDNFVETCLEAVNRDNQQTTKIVLASSNNNPHPVFALWPLTLADALGEFLSAASTRRIMAFVNTQPHEIVTFPTIEPEGISFDPFFNINEPEDLIQAKAALADRLEYGSTEDD